MSVDLAQHGMVGLTRDALVALHGILFRDAGANAAAYLQEAGYAGGGALYSAFHRWIAEQGGGAPEQLTAPDFQQRAARFLGELGWGAVSVGTLHDAVMTVDSPDWAESNPQAGMQYPGCYLTSGLLADFFGRVAGTPLAAMEVECRSMGYERCRFLVGSAETMQHVYDGFAHGKSYDASLQDMP